LIHWLQSEDGERAIAQAAERLGDPMAAVTALRRVWTREQSAAAIRQAELRRRAARKFSRAARMFFLPEALEQASGEAVARWRAERFRPFDRIADLCCGIGGDSLALGEVAWIAGVDADVERLSFARANARAVGLAARCAWIHARIPELPVRVSAAFADPDRRPAGARTRRLEQMAPSLSELLSLHPRIPHLSVKLSPALDDAELSAAVTSRAHELEFISDHGVCKEAVLWLGDLVTARRRASRLPERVTLTDADPAEGAVRAPGAYLFEPDAAVIRAHLVEQIAASLGAWKIDAQTALLSSDIPAASPLARCFAVHEVASPNVKAIGLWLRSRGYGSVIVKRRASPIEPETVHRQLQPYLDRSSPREALLLFTRIADRRVVFLCEPTAGP
jgi:hypothetical protein